MNKNVNLLSGPILPELTKLALPIMATQLLQMAYNLIDMIWIGRVGSNAVAAVGCAGLYMWLSAGLPIIARVGGQVMVAQSLGAKEEEDASIFARGAIHLGLLFGLVFGLLMMVFSGPLIDFFKLNSEEVVSDARAYLMIGCGLVIFSFVNMVLTGIITAMGNSKTPFTASTIGLVINLILDPVLIFGIGPAPKLGVSGAAIATVFSQFIVMILLIIFIREDTIIFNKLHLFKLAPKSHYGVILKIGFPIGIQNMIMAFISMVISRIITGWGDAAVAVQKIGSQVESISWMTAEGFSSAMNSFIGQNFGAKNKARMRKGYNIGIVIAVCWGIIATLLLMLFPQYIFRVFLSEKELIPMGVSYLRILGLSQILMCVEIMTTGAFSGLGKTLPPAIDGLIFNLLRIPLALYLSSTGLGLNGIWWAITITSVVKGFVLIAWYRISFKKVL